MDNKSASRDHVIIPDLDYAQIQGQQAIAVNHNHTLVPMPASTTAITTGAGATMGAASLTVKGPGNFRVIMTGNVNATNTLQAVLTPTITFTANGINTITVAMPAMALPGNTSTPSTGMWSEIVESKVVATLPANTGVPWAPTPGQTVVATLSIAGSATGGAEGANAIGLSMQEIY